MSTAFERAVRAVLPLDPAAMAEARARQDRLTKPRGALGRLEALSVQLAGIAGVCPPPVPSPAAVAVFAADHGVVAEGVTPWPQEVTAQMVANFVSGGAAINVLARAAGASVTVVDVGVATPLPPACDGAPGLLRHPLGPGTANLAVEPAMDLATCRSALDLGAQLAADLVAGRPPLGADPSGGDPSGGDPSGAGPPGAGSPEAGPAGAGQSHAGPHGGARALVTGEMGIGNTTAAAALVAAFTGRAATEVTGRGTGVDDAGLARKTAVVERALARHAGAVATGPLETLAALGGYEIAALAGFIVGGAAAGVPVLVDGLIADAALLAADRLVPGAAARCIAGHRSVEPGAAAVLEELGLAPVLDLDLRLGEGSGACLALPIVEAAARILAEMATFDAAGVTDKER
ncbi:MAG: nicotinate-nucleotide--dimethylbenzimidazole phosphoribosyltransferase [Actinomycetota bacterium]|nr:nicotinate-nucleotide--dimethylbenzimidazole phosphoribosyltransferase [Actinomycetota bacterium]